jgi:hypothetical protein
MVTPFKIGDKVRLLFKVPGYHAGWSDNWVNDMDSGVGEVLVVGHVYTNTDIPEYSCRFPDGGCWNVPGFALELVKSKPIKAAPKAAPKVSKPKPKVDGPLMRAKQHYREEMGILIEAAKNSLASALAKSDRMGFIRTKADFVIRIVSLSEPGAETCPFCQDNDCFKDSCKKCEYGKLNGRCCDDHNSAYVKVCDGARKYIEALEEYRPD